MHLFNHYKEFVDEKDDRLHFSLNLNTETDRLQNEPSNTDIFKVRKSLTAQSIDNTLIIAYYAQN